MAYYRSIETKNKDVKIKDIERYLEDVNNMYFSGLLNIEKYHKNVFIITYEDFDYVVSIDINEENISFRYSLHKRMNKIITQIFSQYIAEKYAKYDYFTMKYEDILYDEIEDKYVTIYEPDTIDDYIKYIYYDIGYIEDDIKSFFKKIKKYKIINKIKIFLKLY